MSGSGVLGLDLATRSGWAFWAPGLEKPRAGTLDLPTPRDGDDLPKAVGRWLRPLFGWLDDFSKLNEIGDIAVETPLLQGDQAKQFKLISAGGVVAMFGEMIDAHVEYVANSTMVSHWIGTLYTKNGGDDRKMMSSDERKTRSVLSAHLRGFGRVQDHNVADALGVLTTRLHQRGEKGVPWDIQKGTAGTLFEGPKGVRIDAGNQRAAAKVLSSALSFERNKINQ